MQVDEMLADLADAPAEQFKKVLSRRETTIRRVARLTSSDERRNELLDELRRHADSPKVAPDAPPAVPVPQTPPR